MWPVKVMIHQLWQTNYDLFITNEIPSLITGTYLVGWLKVLVELFVFHAGIFIGTIGHLKQNKLFVALSLHICKFYCVVF